MPLVICLLVPLVPLLSLLLGCAPLGGTMDRRSPSSSEKLEQEPSLQTSALNDGTNLKASPDDVFSRHFPLWNPAARYAVASPAAPSSELPKEWKGIEALPDGYAIGVSKHGRVLLLRAGSVVPQHLFAIPSTTSMVRVDPTGRVLAAVLPDRLALYALASGREVESTAAIATRLTDLTFDQSGRVLLCAGADGYVYGWDFERALNASGPWQKQLERYAPGDIPGGVAVHPQGRVFFVGTWNGGLAAFLRYGADAFGGKYDEVTEPGAVLRAPTTVVKAAGPDDAVTQLRLAANGERLIVARQSGTLELWKVRGFQLQGAGSTHTGAIYDLSVSPDGRSIASIGRDGFLRSWSISDCVAQTEICRWLPRRSLQLSGARLITFVGASQLLVAHTSDKVTWLDPRGEEPRS